MRTLRAAGRRIRSRSNRSGNAMLEFGLVLPVLVMLLFGVLAGSLALERYYTVLQLARTGGSMYARGVDWLVQANQDTLLRTAGAMDVVQGGDAVVYFSRVTPASAGSVNDGELVITERHVIGETGIQTSIVANPSASIWPDPNSQQPTGTVVNYDDDPSAVATLPAALSTVEPGESLFVVEVYWRPANILFMNSFLPPPSQMGVRLVY